MKEKKELNMKPNGQFFFFPAKMGHQQFHKNSPNHVERKVGFETMIFRIQLMGSLRVVAGLPMLTHDLKMEIY